MRKACTLYHELHLHSLEASSVPFEILLAAWCCWVQLGAAWCCLVLLGAAWCIEMLEIS